jgi:negative elongation factor B
MEENYIERVFEETEDGLDTISSVQEEARVRVSSMHPALPILDLHGVTRSGVHDNLFAALQAKLLGRVDELDQKGLAKLLDKCFRHISSKELRGVCLQIMQKLPEVDEKYLLHISDNQELYQACPIEVKRQIWQTNQGFFGEAVSPLLDLYIAEKESILFSTHETGEKKTPTSFLSIPPKIRRQSQVMQDLVHMVRSSQDLYLTSTLQRKRAYCLVPTRRGRRKRQLRFSQSLQKSVGRARSCRTLSTWCALHRTSTILCCSSSGRCSSGRKSVTTARCVRTFS